MTFLSTFIVLHIISAGLWLANIILSPFFKKAINKESGTSAEAKLISLNLVFTNILGSIGAMGILVTGIIITSLNPGYSFFEFSANHWLVSKQIIMVILLVLIFAFLIPRAKNARLELEKDSMVSDAAKSAYAKVNTISFYINILVIINLFFALSHRFIG